MWTGTVIVINKENVVFAQGLDWEISVYLFKIFFFFLLIFIAYINISSKILRIGYVLESCKTVNYIRVVSSKRKNYDIRFESLTSLNYSDIKNG